MPAMLCGAPQAGSWLEVLLEEHTEDEHCMRLHLMWRQWGKHPAPCVVLHANVLEAQFKLPVGLTIDARQPPSLGPSSNDLQGHADEGREAEEVSEAKAVQPKPKSPPLPTGCMMKAPLVNELPVKAPLVKAPPVKAPPMQGSVQAALVQPALGKALPAGWANSAGDCEACSAEDPTCAAACTCF